MCDVVGLYLNPPENAIVFCVDEKTSIQALDRTQLGLPIKKGRCGAVTHDYKRNGTSILFAALNVATGSIKKYFLAQEILLIEDNAKYHFLKVVQESLKDYPRVRFVVLPSYSRNLNLTERLRVFFKKVLYNRDHKDVGYFRRACIEFFSNINQHDEKNSFFNG